MRIGPVHVIRERTFRRLREREDVWSGFSGELTAAARAGNPLAERVLDHTHGLMHSPLSAAMPAGHPPTTPTPDDAAAARVVAAYQKAMTAAAAPPAPSLWDAITGAKGGFLRALAAGDVPTVRAALDRLFVSDLCWGLGQFHPSHVELLAGTETHLHFRFTDALVSLAEAVGAARLTSPSQDQVEHLRPLNRPLDPLLADAQRLLGFDLSFPAECSAFGFRVNGQLIALDSLYHAATAHRLRQLGGGAVYELGGGYGGLAVFARRAGVGPHTIFDLPWVNALQGYFLIRCLGPAAVRLYGEAGPGEVTVLPYWELDSAPDRSCDLFVNTDSLPEMGAATAAGYIPHVRRTCRGLFLSINQEAKAAVPGVGVQNCVRELVAAAGGFRCLSRHRAWIRQGYAEEVFAPLPGFSESSPNPRNADISLA